MNISNPNQFQVLPQSLPSSTLNTMGENDVLATEPKAQESTANSAKKGEHFIHAIAWL
jgi:hypothetical protein